MIARQRQNLSLTFAANDEKSRTTELAARLSKYQTEIATATQELAEGFIAQGTLQPELQSAVQSMNKAVAEFSENDWESAQTAEQSALRHLIRARQNIRKMLSKSGGQSSSQSRKFDKQQRQKLRTPEEMKKDRQQELAQTRQELEQLAQQQRKWSEELNPPNSGNPSQPQQSHQHQQQQQQQSSQSSSSSSSASQQAQQQQMLDKLQELRKKLAEQHGNTPAGEEAAEQTAEAMKESLEKLAGQQPEEAAAAGKQAAEQMDRLAEHLANMNAQDAGERLKQSQQLADRLASEQKQVSEQISQGSQSSGNGEMSATQRADAARRERALAAEAKMLQELLAGLKTEELGDGNEVGQALENALNEHAPEEIGEQMQDAAAKLEANDTTSAGDNAAGAARELDELANALRGIRAGFAQPQLEELLELESKIAELERRLRAADSDAERQNVAESFAEVEPRLDQLASGDERLQHALEQLRNPGQQANASPDGNQNSTNQNDQAQNGQSSGVPNSQVADGHYQMELSPGGGSFKGVAKALQVKIQEAILAAALQDADEPVPPQYRQLVDEYYQALSDDLR